MTMYFTTTRFTVIFLRGKRRVGKDVEKMEPLHTAGENVKLGNHCGKAGDSSES